nr:hypothetical protein BaRGS_025105 [Batillaria attramentaria]
MSWGQFSDEESGVLYYYATVGRTYSGSELSRGAIQVDHDNSTDVQTFTFTTDELLAAGQLLVFSIQAENAVGLLSPVRRMTFEVFLDSSSGDEGSLVLQRHSCSHHYCTYECTCAPWGQVCDPVGNSTCTELPENDPSLGGVRMTAAVGLPSRNFDFLTSAKCLEGYWTVSDPSFLQNISRFQWSFSLANLSAGMGVFDTRKEPAWQDTGMEMSAAHCLPDPRLLTPGSSYVLHVRAWLSHDTYVTVVSAPVLADHSPPSQRRGGAVIESDGGCMRDVDFVTGQDSVTACWNGVFTDPQTGIDRYEVWVGTSPYGDDHLPRTPVGKDTTFDLDTAAMLDGTRYYVSVRAWNASDQLLKVELSSTSLQPGARAVVSVNELKMPLLFQHTRSGDASAHQVFIFPDSGSVQVTEAMQPLKWPSSTGRRCTRLWLHLVTAGKDKVFKYDVDVGEEESGERFQLHSQGQLAETVDLDSLPQVKRVACAENRLLLALTDSTVAHGWRVGQVVVGSPQKWGCNATRDKPLGVGIYVKIERIEFPVEGRSDTRIYICTLIIIIIIRPFDMLEEADIFFHYVPPEQKSQDTHHHDDSRRRFRRSLYNLVSNIADNIDWHANFSTVLPYDVGQGVSTGTGQNTDMSVDATMKFQREIGLTFNMTVQESPVTELLKVPLARSLGLPPVYLVLSYQSVATASLKLNTAISWHYHDVDIDLAPPAELTTVSIDSNVFIGKAHLTLDAFGKRVCQTLERFGELAVCAGLDSVTPDAGRNGLEVTAAPDGFDQTRDHLGPDEMEKRVEFWSLLQNMGSTHLSTSPKRLGIEEYGIPDELAEETDIPLLVDGGYQPDVDLSEHVTVGDVVSRDSRYFRMDELLLLCVELVIDDFPGRVEVVPLVLYSLAG